MAGVFVALAEGDFFISHSRFFKIETDERGKYESAKSVRYTGCTL